MNKKSIAEMIGELLRDAGVLVIVFYPISAQKVLTLTHAIELSLGALIFGILIERMRKT